MTRESATSLEVVSTLVVYYCLWDWWLGGSAFRMECTIGQEGLKSIFISS